MESYRNRTVRIVTWGGLGDCLMLTPIIRDLKERHRTRSITVFCSNPSHANIFKGNLSIDSIRDVSLSRNLLQYILYWSKLHKVYYAKFDWNELGFLLNRKHFVEALAQDIFGIDVTDKKPLLFLDDVEENQASRILEPYSKSAVIHVTSNSSQNHMWAIDRWNELVERMTDYTFIQIGSASEQRVKGAVDLLGKTTVRLAMALVKNANCFLGVESFFHHVATALNTPSVILLGDSDRRLFSYPGNIYLTKTVPCNPCESLLRRNICPYGKPCIEQISATEVELAIRSIHRGRKSQT